MFGVLKVRCSICGEVMDWMRRYGREGCQCSKRCNDEFEWRRTLAILDKHYYPDPRVHAPVSPATMVAGDHETPGAGGSKQLDFV